MIENRRNFLKLSGLSGVGLYTAGVTTLKGENTGAKGPENIENKGELKLTQPVNRFPSSLHSYYQDKIREKDALHTQKIMGLNSYQEALEYQDSIKRKILDCIGPFPEKNPLNAKVVGKLDRKGYRIELVTYESRPGYVVTANLYLPKGGRKPRPAVLGTCGHTREAKTSVYQHFAQSLALKGYVVLLIDPISQGERLQFPTDDRKSEVKWGVTEHIYVGNPLNLVGESIAGWFAWDCVRGIDYLFTRKEVDQNHIGVTGNSGGGTQTTWLCGVEPRLTMAAPSCFVNTIRRNFENQEVQDAEQYVPFVLENGLDHFDFIAAMAPKPVILISQEKDFFDVRGTEEVYHKLRHFYKLLGAEDNIQLFVGDGYHGYHQSGREAMYGFFNSITKISDDSLEPEIELEKDEDLWCTPNGQLSHEESKVVGDFVREQSLQLKQTRNPGNLSQLQTTVKSVLNIPYSTKIFDYKIFRGRKEPSFPKTFVSDYMVETEPGAEVAVYKLMDELIYSRPTVNQRKAVIYVSHESMDEDLVNDEYVRNTVVSHTDYDYYTCDLRGFGQTAPNTRINYSIAFRSEYFYAMMANLLGSPLLGRRTYDLLCVLDWLKSVGYSEFKIIGKGFGSLPATLASLIDENVREVQLKNPLKSFSEIAESKFYKWPLSCMPFDVLAHFDLPDCYKLLEEKNLIMDDVWDANPEFE
ncbi:alpha/beta hydrolase family protein [Membranihabitans marinus]|uniref:alpha/beta hydrolase family protein n=1 Tax=Membranihabitans marinus TaxID=1227546 RepID=UPI001F2BB2BE|nr:acetylxylan esterase [Membranihabitans marinus]